MTAGAYRDISADRRARAAACVERHLRELTDLLESAALPPRIVEGSAVAAEVFLADTNTLHTAVRAAVYVTPERRPATGRMLRDAGFERTEPTGDTTLLRMAARGGRRPIHVLFDGSDGDAVNDAASDIPGEHPGAHPGTPEARRARMLRIGSAWLALAEAWRRDLHASEETHDVTESFEVQLIERA